MKNAWCSWVLAAVLGVGAALAAEEKAEPAAVPEKQEAPAALSAARLRSLVSQIEERYAAKCAFLQVCPAESGCIWKGYFSGMSGMFTFWMELAPDRTVRVTPLRETNDRQVARARHERLERFPLPWDEVARMEQEIPCGIVEVHMYPQRDVWKIRRAGCEAVEITAPPQS